MTAQTRIMPSARDAFISFLLTIPQDATIEEIVNAVELHGDLMQSEIDIEQGNVYTHEEVMRHLKEIYGDWDKDHLDAEGAE